MLLARTTAATAAFGRTLLSIVFALPGEERALAKASYFLSLLRLLFFLFG